MDCSKCPWKNNREACRDCAKEQRQKTDSVETFTENELRLGIQSAIRYLAQQHGSEQD